MVKMDLGKDSFGDKIKEYEDKYRYYLPNKLPCLIRLDGKNFSKLTKSLEKPFDERFIRLMNEIGIYLCKNIQGAQISYQQSDEISILIYNRNEKSQAWFDNNLQKIVSISASMASGYFTANSNKAFGEMKMVQFDSRAFILPFDEVNNYFEWRQKDCIRNSVQMLARSLFSHKQCYDKNVKELKELCLTKNSNWDELPNHQKKGRSIIKSSFLKEGVHSKTGEVFSAVRSEWIVDNNIPSFDRDKIYIEQYIK